MEVARARHTTYNLCSPPVSSTFFDPLVSFTLLKPGHAWFGDDGIEARGMDREHILHLPWLLKIRST
ncbi:hypothetical protein CP533_0892 [Ophiocordyceps camponoti-saundersi (nom. inval.)]|nr:hypothetical protein CP533_0892 [Ophiocordyceps camponoti-saundersi (nom. inval.)]